MYKLDNFKSCCDYLGIDNTLPVCQIDVREIQAAYKLRVCMKAWNRQDGFEPDETANYNQAGAGYTPYFLFIKGRLRSSGYANYGAYAGFVHTFADYPGSYSDATFGLRLSFITKERAIEFGKTFIETFNELI